MNAYIGVSKIILFKTLPCTSKTLSSNAFVKPVWRWLQKEEKWLPETIFASITFQYCVAK